MRLLRRSAGEIVFLILAGKSAGAKQVLTFLLRRQGAGEKRRGGMGRRVEERSDKRGGEGGGMRPAGWTKPKRGNLQSRARACVCVLRGREGGREGRVFVAATAAWESQNVIRLTDIKLKYPFWEFAASRVADLPVMFSPFLFLSSFPPPPFVRRLPPLLPFLLVRGTCTWDVTGGGKNRIFHCDVVERAGPRVVVNLICLSGG